MEKSLSEFRSRIFGNNTPGKRLIWDQLDNSNKSLGKDLRVTQ